jgi:hypothetical protein
MGARRSDDTPDGKPTWGRCVVSMGDYQAHLNDAIRSFVGQSVYPGAESVLSATIQRARDEFLYQHGGYIALGPVTVHNNGNGDFLVDAPIGTYAQKLEMDYLEGERVRLQKELDADLNAERKRAQKSAANMARMHRRLMRRCAGKIPTATRAIWPSLTIGQQYAILKDIDYAMRHGGKS